MRLLPSFIPAVAVCLALAAPAFGDIIDETGFHGSEQVVTFENLGLPFFTAGSVVVDGHTFAGTNPGPPLGGTPPGVVYHDPNVTGLFNDTLGTAQGTPYGIDIVLGSPVHRAGLWVGTTIPWEAEVGFFDENQQLLQVIGVGHPDSVAEFVGFDAMGGLISSIHVKNLTVGARLFIDNLTTEVGGAPVQPVPEPGTLALLGVGVAGLVAARRRTREREAA